MADVLIVEDEESLLHTLRYSYTLDRAESDGPRRSATLRFMLPAAAGLVPEDQDASARPRRHVALPASRVAG